MRYLPQGLIGDTDCVPILVMLSEDLQDHMMLGAAATDAFLQVHLRH